MVSNVLFKNAKNRVVFEGVEALYQKLTRNKNPLFFISGSSYNLYDMLTNFCRHNNIPKAPFIMRDLGIGDLQWIHQNSQEYKQENIERILKMYPNLKFILIGDSGEKDPEIYLETAKNFPEQVLAIYIRHVHDDIRWSAIKDLVNEVKTPFLLMKDTSEAFDHAKRNGWIK
jgi:phosphatidate phosphatase APP1